MASADRVRTRRQKLAVATFPRLRNRKGSRHGCNFQLNPWSEGNPAPVYSNRVCRSSVYLFGIQGQKNTVLRF